jgi:DNA-binding MarR family transcriptional regulator
MSDVRKDQLALFARSKARVARLENRPEADAESSASKTVGKVTKPAAKPAKPAAKPTKPAAKHAPPSVEEDADIGEQTLRVDPKEQQPRRSRKRPAEPTSIAGSIRARDTGEAFLFPQEKRGRSDMHFSRRLSDLVRRLQLLEREAKAEMGLTLPQAHAIHALNDATSLRMQELAESLGLAQSTVTRLVAPLKRMGLLDRRPDRSDGRATRAFLTDKGTKAVDDLEKKERDLYTELVSLLPETRRAEVVAAIELLHEAVRDITID